MESVKPSKKMTESVEPSNKKRSDVSQRFSFEVTSDELDKLKEGECPANALKINMWALKTFEEWRVTRNKRYSDDVCHEEIFVMDNKQILCEWLYKFVTEVCKGNGGDYTSKLVSDVGWSTKIHSPSETI